MTTTTTLFREDEEGNELSFVLELEFNYISGYPDHNNCITDYAYPGEPDSIEDLQAFYNNIPFPLSDKEIETLTLELLGEDYALYND